MVVAQCDLGEELEVPAGTVTRLAKAVQTRMLTCVAVWSARGESGGSSTRKTGKW